MPTPAPIILASASPRRSQLLKQVGLPLQIEPSLAPEPPHGDGRAEDYCLNNARVKALEVARRFPSRFVIGADTEVILDGRALGKPQDRQHGAALLRSLADREHIVMTAFVIVSASGQRLERAVQTVVRFKALTEREIEGYLDTGEPFDKAGGYGIQGIGTFLVQSISGSYSNVVGLPVAEVLEALAELGGPLAFQGTVEAM